MFSLVSVCLSVCLFMGRARRTCSKLFTRGPSQSLDLLESRRLAFNWKTYQWSWGKAMPVCHSVQGVLIWPLLMMHLTSLYSSPIPALAPWKLDLGPFLALVPAPQTSDLGPPGPASCWWYLVVIIWYPFKLVHFSDPPSNDIWWVATEACMVYN